MPQDQNHVYKQNYTQASCRPSANSTRLETEPPSLMVNYPPLDITRIQLALHKQPIGHTIHHYESVPSTMLLVHALSTSAPSGTIIVTDLQTAGRGRGERRWQTPPGQALLVSVLLKPPLLPAGLHLLPLITGIATAQAIDQVIGQIIEHASKHSLTGPQSSKLQNPVMLKWPNDIVLLPGNPAGEIPAKVGGILIESVYQPTDLSHVTPLHTAASYAVLGIGINLNQTIADLPEVTPPALPPTSLRLAYGSMFDRTDLLIALCRRLSFWLAPPAQSHIVLAEYRRRLVFLNRTIQIHPHHGLPYTAIAHDISDQGELLVTDTTGTRHTLSAADVSIRPDL
jgi:BirA family transcriptional regulator, biotin operon repressor / biotin---[acetyl-CoA-carboxylase] ligase